MEIFSLQIHKKGDFNAFYKGVDSILNKNGLVSGEVNRDIAKQSVAHALQNMIKHKRWFDICTIRSACEVACIRLSSKREAVYSAAHCINWGDMTNDYKQCLIAMVMDDFRELFLTNPNNKESDE